jgi:hypothetical protein
MNIIYFEFLMVLTVQPVFFRVHSEDEGSTFFQNAGTLQYVYMVSQTEGIIILIFLFY